MNFYNENDPKAAAWLRELIKHGHIAPGTVDERSITDLKPTDLHGFTQCHFFAGIGGWSAALRLAQWPDDKPVWTGSCPCQPFSDVGKKQVDSDERHLWPAFRGLITQCKPANVFGEQVASKDGRIWLAGVRVELEALGYVCGASDLCAAGVSAPHRRQRLYFVAYTNRGRREQPDAHVWSIPEPHENSDTGGGNQVGRVANLQCTGLEGLGGHEREGNQSGRERADEIGSIAEGCSTGILADALSTDEQQRQKAFRKAEPARRGSPCRLDNPADQRHERDEGTRRQAEHRTEFPGRFDFWDDYDLIPCRDGKARRVESGTFPLAHGVQARMVRLRGYGNAIVPEIAAEFILASEEAINSLAKVLA